MNGFSTVLPRGSTNPDLLSGRPNRRGTVAGREVVGTRDLGEGSPAADVWLYASDYLDFRKYALQWAQQTPRAS